MNNLFKISGAAQLDAITTGIVNKKHVQIIHKSYNQWQTYKGHFKEGNLEEGINIVEVTPTFGDGEGFSGEVSVNFRLGRKKMFFNSSGYASDIGNSGMANVDWPDNLTAIHRKAFERQPISSCLVIKMRPPHDPLDTIYGEVKNISTGGMEASIRDKKEELLECYHCSIATDPCITTDALVKSVEPDGNGRLTVGLQFIGLELDESLSTIKKIIKLVDYYSQERQAPKQRLPLPWQ